MNYTSPVFYFLYNYWLPGSTCVVNVNYIPMVSNTRVNNKIDSMSENAEMCDLTMSVVIDCREKHEVP